MPRYFATKTQLDILQSLNLLQESTYSNILIDIIDGIYVKLMKGFSEMCFM